MSNVLYALVITSELFSNSISVPMTAEACYEAGDKFGKLYETLARQLNTPESWNFTVQCVPVKNLKDLIPSDKNKQEPKKPPVSKQKEIEV